MQAASSKWRRVEHRIEEQPDRSEESLQLVSVAPLEQVEASLVAARKQSMNKGGRPSMPAELVSMAGSPRATAFNMESPGDDMMSYRMQARRFASSWFEREENMLTRCLGRRRA